jgi:L-ascorbate metabolism protein UlaG (beta-lactamase superfamily)
VNEQLYKPDLAFLPIGDLFTMGPAEAALACVFLRAKKVIPMHFGTFPALTGRPEALHKLVAESGTEIWELTPGETVEW